MSNIFQKIIGTIKNFIGFSSIQEVSTNIFIGNRYDAENIKELKQKGINAILNVAFEVNDGFINGFLQEKVPIHETNNNVTDFQLHMAMIILDRWYNKGYKILVHCWLGENRTPWVISHWLSGNNKTDWKDEFKKIQKIRPECYIKDWMF